MRPPSGFPRCSKHVSGQHRDRTKAAECRDTHKVSAVRVHLAAVVACANIDLGLVDKPNNLHVVRRLHELHAAQRTRGDDARATSGFCAPRDHLALHVAHGRARADRRPEAEVFHRTGEPELTRGNEGKRRTIDRVEKRRLAERGLPGCGGIAAIVPPLGAAFEVVRVGLVRLRRHG